MRRAISIIIIVALALGTALLPGCVLEHETANLVQPQPDGNQLLIVGRSSWALNWSLKPVADILPAVGQAAGQAAEAAKAVQDLRGGF